MTLTSDKGISPDNRSMQTGPSERALDLKRAGRSAPDHPAPSDHPDPGMKSIPFEDQPPSGAFDAEGHRPVLERSRKVR